ncbi:hypothetical protein [Variovorax boronicumulans]|uniref:hypothetical protein n=1 Tax=Variovorax boronicumulans TaxID=436515 RepID=UPI001C59A162
MRSVMRTAYRSRGRRAIGTQPQAGSAGSIGLSHSLAASVGSIARRLVMRELGGQGLELQGIDASPVPLQPVRAGRDPFGFRYGMHGQSLAKSCIFIQLISQFIVTA